MLLKSYKYLFLSFLIYSCASKKEVFYLQNLPPEIEKSSFNNSQIQSGDNLDIKITAINEESVLIFQSFNQKSMGICKKKNIVIY